MNKNNYIKEQNKILQLQIFDSTSVLSPEFLDFLVSDLGRLWQKIPFDSLSSMLTDRLKKQGVHVPSWGTFDLRGGMACIVLKSYYEGMSDAKLIQMLNRDKSVRWFCFMNQPMREKILDKDLLWRWRKFLGEYLHLNFANETTLGSWKSDLEHPHFRLTDATCYEVNIAYPTSVKILWQSCEWIYNHIEVLCKVLGLPSKRKSYRRYYEQHRRQNVYSKKRKKTHKETRHRIGQLLHWLEKGISIISPLVKAYEQKLSAFTLSAEVIPALKRLRLGYFTTIKQVFEQQSSLHKDPKTTIENRIVSLQQPHIRPIVRGKENKRVEFGPKVNMLRVGGVNVIEHFSFDNFNEGTRFETACLKYAAATGDCQQMGADAIYATNKNRSFAKSEGISTGFKRKGKLPSDETVKASIKNIQTVISIIRATHMEGSFGNEKSHYGLTKMRVKLPQTQKVMLFFGVLTANAMAMVNKEKRKKKSDKKKSGKKQRARAA